MVRFDKCLDIVSIFFALTFNLVAHRGAVAETGQMIVHSPHSGPRGKKDSETGVVCVGVWYVKDVCVCGVSLVLFIGFWYTIPI